MSVKGRLKDLSLTDIFQILHNEKKSVAVHLGSENGYGSVYFVDGNIMHASYRDLTGMDAITKLLAWREGEFDLVPKEAPPDITFVEDYDWIISEAKRRFDEAMEKGIVESGMVERDTESAMLVMKLIDLGILERVEK